MKDDRMETWSGFQTHLNLTYGYLGACPQDTQNGTRNRTGKPPELLSNALLERFMSKHRPRHHKVSLITFNTESLSLAEASLGKVLLSSALTSSTSVSSSPSCLLSSSSANASWGESWVIMLASDSEADIAAMSFLRNWSESFLSEKTLHNIMGLVSVILLATTAPTQMGLRSIGRVLGAAFSCQPLSFFPILF